MMILRRHAATTLLGHLPVALTVVEAAELLNVSTRTVYRLIERGKLKAAARVVPFNRPKVLTHTVLDYLEAGARDAHTA